MFGQVNPTLGQRRKFEANKVLKEAHRPHPYAPSQWHSYEARRTWKLGERLHLVIITSPNAGSGPLTSSGKAHEATDLLLVPELKSATRATKSVLDEAEDPAEEGKLDYVERSTWKVWSTLKNVPMRGAPSID